MRGLDLDGNGTFLAAVYRKAPRGHVEMTYGVKQIRERYGVAESTVLGWIRNGDLKALDVSPRKGGRPHWRITEKALDEFEASRATTPPAPIKARRSAAVKQDAVPRYL